MLQGGSCASLHHGVHAINPVLHSLYRAHIISSLHQAKKANSTRATAPPRQAIALASADSAPLPAGYQFSSSPTTSAMYAGPPMDLLERDLSDSQVCSTLFNGISVME